MSVFHELWVFVSVQRLAFCHLRCCLEAGATSIDRLKVVNVCQGIPTIFHAS